MKILSILLLTSFFIVGTITAQEVATKEFSRLSWLEGKWERTNTKEGRTAFEVWKMQGLGLVGEGISMEGEDTVFVEKLSIIQKEGALYYVAEPTGNASPTYFEIIHISDNGFVSENPDHDFPKRIEYLLDENDTLKATISGNGRSIPFIFQKIK